MHMRRRLGRQNAPAAYRTSCGRLKLGLCCRSRVTSYSWRKQLLLRARIRARPLSPRVLPHLGHKFMQNHWPCWKVTAPSGLPSLSRRLSHCGQTACRAPFHRGRQPWSSRARAARSLRSCRTRSQGCASKTRRLSSLLCKWHRWAAAAHASHAAAAHASPLHVEGLRNLKKFDLHNDQEGAERHGVAEVRGKLGLLHGQLFDALHAMRADLLGELSAMQVGSLCALRSGVRGGKANSHSAACPPVTAWVHLPNCLGMCPLQSEIFNEKTMQKLVRMVRDKEVQATRKVCGSSLVAAAGGSLFLG
jgi:hypothetical protein